MSAPAAFPEDERDFVGLEHALEASLVLSARLPDWPFRAPSGFVTIYEFDRLLGSSFGAVVDTLARSHGDESVTVLGLSPDPGYYSDSYGFFPGFRLDASAAREGYGSALRWEPGGDPTGSLGDTLDVIAMAGSSGTWSAFGQRDWEIGLLLTPEPLGAWLDVGVPSFGRDVDLDSIRSPVGWGVPLSKHDLATFWSNVWERGSGQ